MKHSMYDIVLLEALQPGSERKPLPSLKLSKPPEHSKQCFPPPEYKYGQNAKDRLKAAVLRHKCFTVPSKSI